MITFDTRWRLSEASPSVRLVNEEPCSVTELDFETIPPELPDQTHLCEDFLLMTSVMIYLKVFRQFFLYKE